MQRKTVDFLTKVGAVVANAAIVAAIEFLVAAALLGECRKRRENGGGGNAPASP